MKKEIKAKWIKALNSGKYSQTTGVLKDSDGFCCFGVLCELYKKEHKDTSWEKDGEETYSSYTFMEEDALPPTKVMKWAGFKKIDDTRTRNKYMPDNEKYSPLISDKGTKRSLDDLNDSGLTFKEIAKVIKEQL